MGFVPLVGYHSLDDAAGSHPLQPTILLTCAHENPACFFPCFIQNPARAQPFLTSRKCGDTTEDLLWRGFVNACAGAHKRTGAYAPLTHFSTHTACGCGGQTVSMDAVDVGRVSHRFVPVVVSKNTAGWKEEKEWGWLVGWLVG